MPREMLEEPEDDFFDEKLAKDARNNNTKKCLLDDWRGGTPPPSPEPKIKATVLDPDHSTLFKILKEEAAEESNMSSMTPSLTELEAALSDMLEKEDSVEGGNRGGKEEPPIPKILEPVIEELRADERKMGRKVSFCSWEESIADLPDRPVSPRDDTDPDPPKKPNRSNKSTEEDFSDLVPTPPRRKNKSSVARKESEMKNDRLI